MLIIKDICIQFFKNILNSSIKKKFENCSGARTSPLRPYVRSKILSDSAQYFASLSPLFSIQNLTYFQVGTTCTFFLSENMPVAPDMLRHIASGVLSAMQYLHDNNIVHRDLRDTSIHIDRTGMIKVSDYSLEKRLSDIYRSNCLAKAEQDFPTIQGRGGKKLDIYRFGILLVSLFRGALVTEIDPGWGMNMQVR